jgi:hypothetical protein
MTDIEAKALALTNEVLAEWGVLKKAVEVPKNGNAFSRALLRAIEQHEAFKQEVSDAVEAVGAYYKVPMRELDDFVIPKPKPDPLVAAMDSLEWCNTEALAKDLRAELEAFGLEIREKGQ